MKKLLAAVLLCAVFTSPAFAKKPHQKYDYRYHAPKKIKIPKYHKHNVRPHSAPKNQSH